MASRFLTLLTALLVLVLLSGCGTDTKTTNDLGGSNFTANHSDFATTSDSIEGYVIKKDADGKLRCGDCHKPDQSEIKRHREWAESAHGGHILAVGVVPKDSPWAHYNWDNSTGNPRTSPDPDRNSCQQCHTATGNSNFMKAQAAGTAYLPANNDFSHLEGWTSTNKTSGQNELLYCWGCHSDVETGTLHAPNNIGIKPGYNVDGTALQLPNLGSSNACVGCHSGRGNIQSLMSTAPTGAIDPTVLLTGTTTPKNTAIAASTHYLNAAATIFNVSTKVGYEFPAQDYSHPAFLHDSSSCVACHMKSATAHSFMAITRDATSGEITTINTQTTCDACHVVIVMNATVLQQAAAGYGQALEALNAALIRKGYIWTPDYPYFRYDSNGDGKIDSTDSGPLLWARQGDLGAAHNYNYLLHETGAYAHNSNYAKRLIFDSIDWLDGDTNLDGNNMDGEITIDAASPAARLWLNADAATGIALRP